MPFRIFTSLSLKFPSRGIEVHGVCREAWHAACDMCKTAEPHSLNHKSESTIIECAVKGCEHAVMHTAKQSKTQSLAAGSQTGCQSELNRHCCGLYLQKMPLFSHLLLILGCLLLSILTPFLLCTAVQHLHHIFIFVLLLFFLLPFAACAPGRGVPATAWPAACMTQVQLQPHTWGQPLSKTRSTCTNRCCFAHCQQACWKKDAVPGSSSSAPCHDRRLLKRLCCLFCQLDLLSFYGKFSTAWQQVHSARTASTQ